jgi:hypothetical protein
MEIPQGKHPGKGSGDVTRGYSGIADSLKPEEQKLIEWLSKQEGRKLTPQEEYLSGFKRLTAFRTARARHRLVAYNLNHLATMRF